ncbi:hypothetical protein [Thermoactinomyces sp. DSM 45892]|uniref:hypothetical protein n=1 Tax=Thermoactinomyces sp. DSM 45892 TaxID=1882753 RepID=UPI000894AC24|nr:hypothetical protein [Thermoactinomyces sp. DSM 45892]SDY66026.1 hypothetical protein SAMN05444416_1071 [Thermoactinomyces sp. DSM 45892]
MENKEVLAYVNRAMKNLGYRKCDIEKVTNEMYSLFDWYTPYEAVRMSEKK